MERSFSKWYEVSYQKVVYGPTYHENTKFHDLKNAYKYADEIKERFPRSKVWIEECTLEKKEIA